MYRLFHELGQALPYRMTQNHQCSFRGKPDLDECFRLDSSTDVAFAGSSKGLSDQWRRKCQGSDMLTAVLIASRVPTAVDGRAATERRHGAGAPRNLRHKRPEVIPSFSRGKDEPVPKLSCSQSAVWQSHHQHVLHGSLVTLEPLSKAHTRELLAIVSDERIWRFLTSCASTEDSLERYVADALKNRVF
jgi:hypothetical protein